MATKSKKEVEAILSGMGVFVGIISGLVELVKKLGGTMENIYQLAKPEGSAKLEVIARLIVETAEKKVERFLRLISGGESIVIDAVDGTETLADAKDVFNYIDSDLKGWGTDEKGPATGETPASVYEMEKDATYAQMFCSLTTDIRKLCLTQAQIKAFVKKHRNWLRSGGYGTFFLFESNGEFFVANVLVDGDGRLEVDVSRFGRSRVWGAEYRLRVVVPQLAL